MRVVGWAHSLSLWCWDWDAGLVVCAAPTVAKMAGTGAPCGRSNRTTSFRGSLLLVLPLPFHHDASCSNQIEDALPCAVPAVTAQSRYFIYATIIISAHQPLFALAVANPLRTPSQPFARSTLPDR